MYKQKKPVLPVLALFISAGLLFTPAAAEEETVAESSFPLVTGEATCLGSNLADLTADAMQWYAANNGLYKKSDFSLVSEKVFTGSIPAGVLTEEDIRAAFRSDAVMVEIKAAGGRFLRVMDDASLNVPEADEHYVTPGNLRYTIDPSQPGFPQGERYSEETARVLSIVKGKRSDVGWINNYRVVADQYLLEISPELLEYGEVEVSAEDGVPIADIVIAYMHDSMNGAVSDQYADPYGDDRVRVITGAALEYDAESGIYTYEMDSEPADNGHTTWLAVPEALLTKKHQGIIGNSFYTRSFLAQFEGQDQVTVCDETIHNVLVPVTRKSGKFTLSYGTAPGQKANNLGFIFVASLMLLMVVIIGKVSRQNVEELTKGRNTDTRSTDMKRNARPVDRNKISKRSKKR